MITLNLISPAHRSHLGRRRAIDELHSLSVTLLYVTILAGFTLGAARYLLSEQLEVIKVASQAETESAEQAGGDRAVARLIGDTVSSTSTWSPFLVAFSQTVPPGLHLASLEVDRSGTVVIRGHADTRDQLLSFQTNLGRSGLVNDLRSPVQNLLKPTDVSFEVRATVADMPATSTTQL